MLYYKSSLSRGSFIGRLHSSWVEDPIVNAGFTGLIDGAMAFVDGALDAIPLLEIKPFEGLGLYDSSQFGLNYSQGIGGATRDAAMFLSGAAAWRAMPVLGGGSFSLRASLGLSFSGVTPYGIAVGGTPTGLSFTGQFITTQAMRYSTFENLFPPKP